MMSGVNIEYKGESIATIPDAGSKTIKTQGKYCEGDILVEYEAPPTPTPTLITKQITENGTYTAADDNADGYSEVTVAVPPPVEEKDVNLFDYTGDLLYSYTKEEALALTELPTLPIHELLTADSWGRTLSEIKEYLHEDQVVDVGVNYHVTDGKTRLFVDMTELTGDSIKLLLQIKNGSVIVYVDGVYLLTESESSNNHVSHTIEINSSDITDFYSQHVIELEVSGNGASLQLGQDSLFLDKDKASLIKVFLGEKCTIGSSAFAGSLNLSEVVLNTENAYFYSTFSGCISLKSLSIPVGEARIDYVCNRCASLQYVMLPKKAIDSIERCVGECAALKHVILPDISIVLAAIYNNSSLRKIILSHNASNIGTYFGERCISLQYAVIPVDVKYTFRYCPYLIKIKLLKTMSTVGIGAYGAVAETVDITDFVDPSTIPALNSSTVFPKVKVIYVANQEMLDAFSAATNWSTYADRFQIKEATP